MDDDVACEAAPGSPAQKNIACVLSRVKMFNHPRSKIVHHHHHHHMVDSRMDNL
jgi:hypothetical protein